MNFKKKNPNYCIILIVLLLTSCSTPLQEITYLNEIKTNQPLESGPLPNVYTIRPNDQLYIQVISADPLDAAFLNLSGAQATGGFASTTNMEIITYLVDEQGYIQYPYLGRIEMAGRTLAEANNELQSEVNKYLESASVFVKLVNRNITVLGEVRSPGQMLMVKNQLTIFEALGAAGDVTDYGNRKNVKIIRESENGKYVAELDLTNPAVMYSPYYYILPHDIIYVQHSTKVYGAKNLPYAAPLTIFSSVVSIGLLILNLFI